MLGNAHFYNRTIRKVVVAFGTLFNDIMLVRYNKAGTTEYERFKVPLSYGSKEKYLTRITSDPNLTKSVQTVVPRISFDLTGMSYDSGRKQVTTLRNFAANTSAGGINTQYAPDVAPIVLAPFAKVPLTRYTSSFLVAPADQECTIAVADAFATVPSED